MQEGCKGRGPEAELISIAPTRLREGRRTAPSKRSRPLSPAKFAGHDDGRLKGARGRALLQWRWSIGPLCGDLS
jgi:hypothetical protein